MTEDFDARDEVQRLADHDIALRDRRIKALEEAIRTAVEDLAWQGQPEVTQPVQEALLAALSD